MGVIMIFLHNISIIQSLNLSFITRKNLSHSWQLNKPAICTKLKINGNDEDMSFDRIDNKIESLQKDLFWLRIKRATRQDLNPADFNMARRKIAQLLSVRRKKQIEEGEDRSSKRIETLKSNQKTNSTLMRIYQIKRTENK